MRLLIVSSEFPPLSSPGAVRMFDLAEDLRKMNVDVFVLSRAQTEDGTWRLIRDNVEVSESLKRNLDKQRVKNSFGLRIDNDHPYVKQGIQAANAAIDSLRIDLVLATSNPLSTALIGAGIKKQHGISTILEFRDPWSLNPLKTWRTRFHYAYFRRMEKKTISHADGIIMNVPAARDQLLRGFPNLNSDRVHAIPHGFRKSRFECDNKPSSQTLRFGYAGGYYPAPVLKKNLPPKFFRYNPGLPDSSTYTETTPATFLEAFKIAIEMVDPNLDAEFAFIGGGLNEYIADRISQLDIDSRIKDLGRISQGDVAGFLKSCHALCLANPGSFLGSYGSPFMSTKTVDYMAAGRPIITFMGESDNLEMVRRSGLGLVAELGNFESLIQQFAKVMTEFKTNKSVNSAPKTKYISRFEREYQAGLFKKIFDVTLKNQPQAVIADIY